MTDYEENLLNNFAIKFEDENIEEIQNLTLKEYPCFASLLKITNLINSLPNVKINYPQNKKFERTVALGRKLVQSNWPICVINPELEKIFDKLSNQFTEEECNIQLLQFFDNNYIKNLLDGICNYQFIEANRKECFKKAYNYLLVGDYYACTCILMCNLYGLVLDKHKLYKSNGFYKDMLSDDCKGMVIKLLQVSNDKSNRQGYIDNRKEKIKILEYAFLNNKGGYFRRIFACYVNDKILSSTDDEMIWKSTPLRNKICHGNQLICNRIHAIKSFICIESLLNLSLINLNQLTDNKWDFKKEG